MTAHPEAALSLWGMFESRFNPHRNWTVEERLAHSRKFEQRIEDIVRSEQDITKDRVLRSLASMISATVRTNFFLETDTVALKIATSTLEFAPSPRPLYEIFVHGQTLEGVHLRMSTVSRGGIRWSERPDDFRTEVLGLVRTQQMKNVFIVPQGAKGGFILRNVPEGLPLPEAVRAGYVRYIRSLLTLADNREGGTVRHPYGVIAYDMEDPYFVVAADKGTATFSDTANGIAQQEFKFWLDDAFASGGSFGYDHKKYGITARGAWECVKRHFHDLGIRYETEPFSVVGIGDMAGDVFGNGLLVTDTIRLLAAFNHKHIFLDPNPDPKRSYAERVRLFSLPRSQWSDYNRELISEGGGVFERSAKAIRLTPAVRAALSVPPSMPEEVPGEGLVSLILTAKVDLLWNGGIGTYVKASSESSVDVNDSANDRVRVNATELRCRVVGEGGNLGFTQKARVEFAILNGRINTDAIDNSAGVGLSDGEVNLKILFASLMSQGLISREERNSYLSAVADEVCERVLDHNRNHAYRITSSSVRSAVQHEYFKLFLTHLSKVGLIQRSADVLPDDEQLHERLSNNLGMMRPELAVCLAASKAWLRGSLTGAVLLQDTVAERFLLDYFPASLSDRFREEVLNHPLREHIIASGVTNTIVDVFGISFPYRVSQNHAASVVEAAAVCVAAYALFDGKVLIESLRNLDTTETADVYLRLRGAVEQGLRDAAAWLLANAPRTQSSDALFDRYQSALVSCHGGSSFHHSPYSADIAALQPSMRDLFARVVRSSALLDLVELHRETSAPFDVIAELHGTTATLVGLDTITSLAKSISTQNRAEYLLVRRSIVDARKSVRLIVQALIGNGVTTGAHVHENLSSQPGFAGVTFLVQELQNLPGSVAHVALAGRQLYEFATQSSFGRAHASLQ